MKENWDQRIGVYAICTDTESLLVIDKKQGPYRNRYDLPGGGIEPNESMHNALHREMLEETGLKIQILEDIGTCEFLVPSPVDTFTHLHHIVHLCFVHPITQQIQAPTQFDEQDVAGAHWVNLKQLTPDKTSPLVHQAKQWLETQTCLNTLQRLDNWHIKDT